MIFPIKELRNVRSVEDLLTLVKEKGGEMTEEDAASALRSMEQDSELSDETLEQVAGGSGWRTCYNMWLTPEEVVYKFGINQHVEAITSVGSLTNHVYTVGCTVIGREARPDPCHPSCFIPYYLLRSGDPRFNGHLIPEHDIEGGYSLIISN